MKRIVVGTAGHIDHGKTTLVKALTGIDTDRLQEEKALGITIDLGFAHMMLPGSGQRLAFVDVPGHERFVRTMIAGVSGIDVVLLVIAADEGVMPQTREHLAISRLLGVEHGALVLTKVDLVDEELLALAEEDVREFVVGTFLEGAPIIACSGRTGEGLEALLAVLEGFGDAVEERSEEGAFRLPVDRVFSLRGFGTVLTGTVASGAVSVGDTLEVCPTAFQARVRGLQVHGEDVRRACAGQRTAVNLQGVDRDRLERGDQLSTPGELLSSSILDVAYEHLTSSPGPLVHRSRIRFLSGTTEVDGVAHLLPGEALAQGERGYLQLRLDAPVAARAGDRFVLRMESPVITLGGGRVLDPTPAKHRRRGRLEAAGLLARLESEKEAERLEGWLILGGPLGVEVGTLSRRSGLSAAELREGLRELVGTGCVVALDQADNAFVARDWLEESKRSILARLKRFHEGNPLKGGAPRGELRGGDRFCGERVFMKALGVLKNDGELETDGPLYRKRGFRIRLSDEDARLARGVEQILARSGLAAPLLPELREQLEEDDDDRLLDLLGYLVSSRVLEKIREGYWVERAALERLREELEVFIEARGELRPSDFKEMTGLSRKWAIPLLEYFDKSQVTLRVGDVRVLRSRGQRVNDSRNTRQHP